MFGLFVPIWLQKLDLFLNFQATFFEKKASGLVAGQTQVVSLSAARSTKKSRKGEISPNFTIIQYFFEFFVYEKEYVKFYEKRLKQIIAKSFLINFVCAKFSEHGRDLSFSSKKRRNYFSSKTKSLKSKSEWCQKKRPQIDVFVSNSRNGI